MRYRALLALLCCFATHSWASGDPLGALKQGQPEEVKKLIDRIALCTHWSGEEPYDAERRREIAAAMKQSRCDWLEKDEVAARKRYARRRGVLEVLRRTKEASW